jgi:USP8 interacting
MSACVTSNFQWDGKKLKQVSVTDLAELYSTYKLTKDDRKELATQLTNQSLIDQIATYSLEENWPDGINTLNKRLKERSNLQRYHFYKVATCGNKTVLAVPADKNRHMPQGFVPAGAMYMIFKSSAVTSKQSK